MHKKNNLKLTFFKTERKECFKKSLAILIQKSKTSPRVINKIMEKKFFFSMFKSS